MQITVETQKKKTHLNHFIVLNNVTNYLNVRCFIGDSPLCGGGPMRGRSPAEPSRCADPAFRQRCATRRIQLCVRIVEKIPCDLNNIINVYQISR